jgi:hypothetical protein
MSNGKAEENAANMAAIRAFRANHPVNEFIEDEYVRRVRVYKALVERTDKKYRKLARKQKAKRELEAAIRRYEEQQKEKRFNEQMRGGPGW